MCSLQGGALWESPVSHSLGGPSASALRRCQDLPWCWRCAGCAGGSRVPDSQSQRAESSASHEHGGQISRRRRPRHANCSPGGGEQLRGSAPARQAAQPSRQQAATCSSCREGTGPRQWVAASLPSTAELPQPSAGSVPSSVAHSGSVLVASFLACSGEVRIQFFCQCICVETAAACPRQLDTRARPQLC